MTEHPGEQFPPDVDPDVEPGFDPYPAEGTPETPDYDAEPAPQDFSYDGQPSGSWYGGGGESYGGPSYGGGGDQSSGGPSYGGDGGEAEVDTEAAFEASLDEPGEPAGHVDPAEVEFGPEFARAPGQEHEHPFAAGSAEQPEHAEHIEDEHQPAGEAVADYSADDEAAEDAESAGGFVAGQEPGGEAVAEYSADDEDPEPVQGLATGHEAADGGGSEYPADEDVADEDRAHPLVEETMGRLGELRDRPVGEHADVYADLHERLQSALVEADAEPGDRGQSV